MDELLQEFLSETGENLDTVDRELVRFEQNPNDREILRNIFRLVHTVKGTCGFIGLPRLEALTHAAESVIGQFRDGATVTALAVTAILETLDRIKEILAELGDKGQEPAGNDAVLIDELCSLAQLAKKELSGGQQAEPALPVMAASSAAIVPVIGEADPMAAYLARHQAGGLDLEFRRAPEPERGTDGRIVASPETTRQSDTATAVEARASAPGPATLRVNVDTIEHLMTMVSELVLTRNQLLEIARQRDDAGLKTPLQRLSLITAELQDGVMKTRMQPIRNALSKLPRIVRDLGNELGKRIELVTDGDDTELDRQVLDMIKDPLTHMVRNCCDHAIEPPAERRAAGKPEFGTIQIRAYHEGGSVTIAVSDDGAGLDLARIRRKALQKNIVSEADLERMNDAQVSHLIFHPGFTTADTITAVSGRGVGMDVVKANVDAIGGVIDIATAPGQGTTVTIKIPLTLAIVSALIVACGKRRFAIPQLVVRELVRVKAGGEHQIERINGAPVLRLRERLLPIVSLPAALGIDDTVDDGFIVVSQIGEFRFGMLVDGVFHTEEIVVKPMSAKLRHIPLFSGNTILGDGSVVLIIDPNGIARIVGATAIAGTVASSEDNAPASDESDRATMLVFRAGESGMKAVPLSLVTRLEEVDAAGFETSGGQTLLNYRGRLAPVLPVHGAQLRREGLQPLVIVSHGDKAVALAVDAIVDIVDEPMTVEIGATDDSGLIGSAMIRGRATDILDLGHYLRQIDPGWLGFSRKPEPTAGEVLLVEPSPFLREMLVPVIKATGLGVRASVSLQEAVAALQPGATVLVDLDADTEAAFAFARQARTAGVGRIVGLASFVGNVCSTAAAEAGIEAVVAKFDRRTLLGELTAPAAPRRAA